MIHFHTLQIRKIARETDDCVSITLDVPDHLKTVFAFQPGQSLTIRKWLNGAEVRRNYSICTSPLDGVLQVAVKKVPGGIFSTYANEVMQAGEQLEVMPPVGQFHTPLHPEQKKNYVAFAAGSGITPVLSILKSTLLTEPESTFTLVYGNRTKSSILFKEALEALKDKFLDRLRIYHMLSREKTDAPLNYGRIDRDKCSLLFQKLIRIDQCDEFFLCGPEEMIFCVRDFLLEQGVPKERIHFELFTIPGQKKSTVDTEHKAVADQGPKASVSVKLDGILFHFDLRQDGLSILDAALQEGADLPYACKGGVCCTCKARLMEGQVEMEVNWGLEQDELEQGFILTCQAHPRTEKVVVDFDVK